MKKSCKECKKLFELKSNHQLYCSEMCLMISKKLRLKNYSSKYYQKNILIISDYKKKHRTNNITKYNEYHQKYQNNRKNTDISFRILGNLRLRLWKSLKGINKSKVTLKLLGCSIEELKKHLESKFTAGMDWKNYGYDGWHIDHIRPCASFDLTKSEEQSKCFHYLNLQPMWALDNISKGDRYEC